MEVMMAKGELKDAFLRASFPPHQLGHWAMEAEALNKVQDLIAEHQPETVLECGSGISTLCMAHWLGGKGDVISLEENPGYLHNIRELCELYGLSPILLWGHVDYSHPGTKQFYNLDVCFFDQFVGENEVDMLVIDGPVGRTARIFALPTLMAHLKAGCIVVVDDYKRDMVNVTTWEDWNLVEPLEVLDTNKGVYIGRIPA